VVRLVLVLLLVLNVVAIVVLLLVLTVVVLLVLNVVVVCVGLSVPKLVLNVVVVLGIIYTSFPNKYTINEVIIVNVYLTYIIYSL